MPNIEIFIRDGSIHKVRVNTHTFLAKSMSLCGLHVIVMESRSDGTYYNWVTVPLSTLTPDMLNDYTTDVRVIKRVLALIFSLVPK